MSGAARRFRLLPLFLVSAAAVGFETALTRYFAVAKWSEYGYWVISIAMAGLALSGVVTALARSWLLARLGVLRAALPVLLILAAAIGYHLATRNKFNPLELQNTVTWPEQLLNIGGYYLCLLPFFFLAGLFISLAFVADAAQPGRVYAADLTGAGAGTLLVLGLMFLLHPFRLIPALLAPLLLAALLAAGALRGARRAGVAAALVAFGLAEALLLAGDAARFDEFKPIYAPLHVPDSRVVAELRAPRGLYSLLDDFTERVDTDFTNDAGALGLPGPPRSLGLFRDGARIAALPGPAGLDARYAAGTLDALPYILSPDARVLLAGASGGFRVQAALTLGAARVTVLEPEPVLFGALRHGIGPVAAIPADPRLVLRPEGLLGGLRAGRYDIVDVSADFLDESEANSAAFTVGAISAALRALAPGGVVSLPVSIREFPAYTLRLLATARDALRRDGLDPLSHVLVYRSAWNARMLLSRDSWSAERIAQARRFCDDRSFDLSYYPGIDVAAARARVYNDLPSVSFEAGAVSAAGPDDAIADEAGVVLAGLPTASSSLFDLSPITLDRPFFHDVLRLSRLPVILARIEALPQAEIGKLVNLAVLVQAVPIALAVLLLPLLARRRLASVGGAFRMVPYFAALGLGFLFIEIYLIEKASLYLSDRATGFGLVLSLMLILSGLGSLLAQRFAAAPHRFLRLAGGVIVGWCLLAAFGLQPLLMATLSLPWMLRAAVIALLLVPVSVALGLPFPLGLARLGDGSLLAWAWALNGAFSVLATPLANLLALEAGFRAVLILAAMLYTGAVIVFPAYRKGRSWQDIPAGSAGAS